MSVMSAAGAGRTGQAGPELPVPRRRLSVATPAAGEDRKDGPEDPRPGMAWGAEADGGRSRAVGGQLRSTELHVREVRVVRRAYARVAAGGQPGPRSQVAARRTTATQTRAVTRPATPGRRARRPGAVRLTRRGRRVVAGLAMLLVIAGAMLIWMTAAGSVQASSGGAGASPYQGMTQVVVRPGQTLWSIAAAAEPSADPWDVVQQIAEVNALNGSTVRAGQLLWVPKA